MPTTTISTSPSPADDGMTTQGALQGTLQGTPAADLAVASTRPRQTARPANPFRNMLSGGGDLLVRGAAVATSVVAGPSMAAAVRDVGAGASAALAGSSMAGPRPGPYAATATGSGGALPIPLAGSSVIPSSMGSTGSDQSDLATVQTMQRESQAFNLQLLELQEDVQQYNRRFTTVSNVLRAKHDTAKAAVSNIRG